MVKNPPANANANAGDVRDVGLIPGSGRSPGRGYGNPFHILAWRISHGQKSLVGYSPWVSKSHTPLKQLSMHTEFLPGVSQVC